MSKNVCYRIERQGGGIVLTQIWPNNQRYIKMTPSSAEWVAHRILEQLNRDGHRDALPKKAKTAAVSKAQKMADFLFGDNDDTK